MPATETLAPTDAGLARAARLLAEGALVAFPTETVYGLGADAGNGRAVAAVFAAKGRPVFNPLIVHVANLEAARRLAVFDATAERLAGAFWPGPLTLVLPRRPDAPLPDLVAAGLPTVALRVPDHPVAQGLLAAFSGPVAAPSANPSGRISPTRAQHVLAGLEGRIAAVLDGGACPVGLESTIVGFDAGRPVLLRAGGISAEALARVAGQRVPSATDGAVQAPGMLASHYAPRAPVRLDVTAPRAGEFWVGFGPGCDGAALNLSPAGDLTEAAATLFDILHRADADGRLIAFAPVPRHGLGVAINDRLARAAAPRGSDNDA